MMNQEYRGELARNVVAFPIGDYVVGVHVASQSHILPRVEDSGVALPNISYCEDRHIIRLPDSVVVIDVEARMSVYPRTLSFSQVEVAARESLLEILEKDNRTPTPAAYANGLKALTQRITRRMQQHGVEIV